MVKIALTGKMRSGKDSVADMLEEKHRFVRFKFSEGIWDTLEMLWGIKDEPFQAKPRKMLQGVGQKLREVDEQVWVNYTLKAIERQLKFCKEFDRPENVVITDLRQPNEYERLREEGFVVVRVSAPDESRRHRAIARGDIFTNEDMHHETESHIDGFVVDYEIVNDGNFAELEEKVDEVYRQVAGE